MLNIIENNVDCNSIMTGFEPLCLEIYVSMLSCLEHRRACSTKLLGGSRLVASSIKPLLVVRVVAATRIALCHAFKTRFLLNLQDSSPRHAMQFRLVTPILQLHTHTGNRGWSQERVRTIELVNRLLAGTFAWRFVSPELAPESMSATKLVAISNVAKALFDFDEGEAPRSPKRSPWRIAALVKRD